jgi:hypothetical protein
MPLVDMSDTPWAKQRAEGATALACEREDDASRRDASFSGSGSGAPSWPEPTVRETDSEDADAAEDAGAAEYGRLAAARRDLRVVVSSLDEASRQLKGLADELRCRSPEKVSGGLEPDEEIEIADQIASSIDQLTAGAKGLVARGLDQKPDLAFSVVAQMAAVETEVKDARERLPTTGTWMRVWAILKRVSLRLWSLISHLVKVKEWSVTGEVGTGVLGLAKASISVKFGP